MIIVVDRRQGVARATTAATASSAATAATTGGSALIGTWAPWKSRSQAGATAEGGDNVLLSGGIWRNWNDGTVKMDETCEIWRKMTKDGKMVWCLSGWWHLSKQWRAVSRTRGTPCAGLFELLDVIHCMDNPKWCHRWKDRLSVWWSKKLPECQRVYHGLSQFGNLGGTKR